MRKIIVLLGLLLLIPIVTATIDIAPRNPTIGGNNWVFMTFNDTSLANQTINITLYDNNNVLKTSCIRKLNIFGYTNATCKYTFNASDTSGEWKFSINKTVPENRSINVSKIKVNLTNKYVMSEISYGSKVKLLMNISYEGSIPKEITFEGLSKDLGTMLVNSYEDTNGDGRKEIVVPELGGFTYIWQNLTRLFDGIPNVTGQDFQSGDFGAGYAQQKSCHFGDFNGDGKKTMICADTNGYLRAYVNINISAGATANNPVTYSSDDAGTYRGDLEICDVNGDGIYDQVAAETYEGPIVFYQFNETAGFTKLFTANYSANAQDSRPLCADFDGDGYNEWIIWSGAPGAYFVDVNLSDANYNVTTPVVAVNDRGTYLQGTAVDYNHDGRAEALFPYTTGYVQTLRWNGTALVENMTNAGEGTDITDFVAGSSNIRPDDLDHDGLVDFVIAGSVNHPPLLFYEYHLDNTSKWNRTIIDHITEQTTSRVEYADFDGDGFKEVIAFGRYSGNTYIYRFNGGDDPASAWDLIYKGWSIGNEEAWSGDGIVYAATPVDGWYVGGCASGDMDDDGKDELLCTPYDGNFILYQEADTTEFNVSPQLYASQTINDGSYENVNSLCSELRLMASGTNLCIQTSTEGNLAQTANVVLGNNNSVDETNHNQGNISTRWTDGIVSTTTYRASQAVTDYATLDPSAVAMATYSRIKLGANYTIGKIIMRNYHNDGRSFNNVVLQSTTNDTGNLCTWNNLTTLYNNSDGGPNRKYSESSVGRRVYIEPTLMNCFRESTSGSDYANIVANNANYRTELDMYTATATTYYSASIEREADSMLHIGDNWTTTLRLVDRTGLLVNISASYTLPVVNTTMAWCPISYNAIIISNDATTPLIIN